MRRTRDGASCTTIAVGVVELFPSDDQTIARAANWRLLAEGQNGQAKNTPSTVFLAYGRITDTNDPLTRGGLRASPWP